MRSSNNTYVERSVAAVRFRVWLDNEKRAVVHSAKRVWYAVSLRGAMPNMISVRLSIQVLFLAGFLTAAAHAQVEASLVAADSSIQPGHTLRVALQLTHNPHWHTYWINPGIGLATTLTWQLPEGFKAGSIQWPAPEILYNQSGDITGSGYDGELLLPVAIATPSSLPVGQNVVLAVTAKWLMCETVCIPAQADLALTLPVLTEMPAVDPLWGAKIARVIAELPEASRDWRISARRNANSVTLLIKSSAAHPHIPKDLHFFSEDKFIDYELPQKVKDDGAAGYEITLQIASDMVPTSPSKLVGVLTAENGWDPDGSRRGLRIDAPFGSTSNSVRATKSAWAPAPH
jgi:DsbC/DsbD-like thiol-disulfide interchange protein